MLQALSAYQNNDIAALELIFKDEGSRPEEIQGEDVVAKLIRSIRRLSQINIRLSAIDNELEALNSNDIYKLKLYVDAKESLGENPLCELAQQIKANIDLAKQTLHKLKLH